MRVRANGSGGYTGAGFGRGGKPSFWLSDGGKTAPRLHVAFLAENRTAVDAFYEAALAAGGTDNGRPGLRVEYHPSYFGAFVLDPDGHNIEAFSHRPE
jgi:catechol 2,3-dioxygenase-like lactoylglutathione lyase family enzyme